MSQGRVIAQLKPERCDSLCPRCRGTSLLCFPVPSTPENAPGMLVVITVPCFPAPHPAGSIFQSTFPVKAQIAGTPASPGPVTTAS